MASLMNDAPRLASRARCAQAVRTGWWRSAPCVPIISRACAIAEIDAPAANRTRSFSRNSPGQRQQREAHIAVGHLRRGHEDRERADEEQHRQDADVLRLDIREEQQGMITSPAPSR